MANVRVERLGCPITAFDSELADLLALGTLHRSKGFACSLVGVGRNSAERNYNDQ